ncbi:MAG: carbon-nitrogen hydrolase family protein [Rickettsiales bacterium]|jgi:predicted amidohydrolase|nr:carbon-nitrogen hydrolase family protein [Rickettsiales bacterium]
MPLKLALIQMNSGADMDANITALQHAIKSAADQGARLVVTPENTFLMDEPKAVRPLYTQGQHPGVLAAAQMAKQHGVWLLVGSVAVTDSDLRLQDSGKTYNRSILFSPEGNITATYDKIHLFDVEVGDGQSYRESAKMIAGERAVVAQLADSRQQIADGKELSAICHLPSAFIGLTICYDLRFAYLYRQLAHAGANILCVPSAFTQVTGEAHWHVLLRARAIENGCFVIAPAQCGTHPGNRKTYGHSLVVDPWGRVIADGGTEPGIVLAEIDLYEVENIRRKLPCLKHDRTYTS